MVLAKAVDMEAAVVLAVELEQAADMVLLDDNFASIEAAAEEGRGVWDNLVKFITWTLPTNFGEGLVIVAAILAGATLPITPLQILWINMTTAVLLGLPLAFEPIEKGIMRRPPRRLDQPVLDRALIRRIVLVSFLLLAGACLGFATLPDNGTAVLIFGLLLGLGWGVFYTLGPIVVAMLIEPAQRVKHFALLSGSMMTGIGTGPLLGRVAQGLGYPLAAAFAVAAGASGLRTIDTNSSTGNSR